MEPQEISNETPKVEFRTGEIKLVPLAELKLNPKNRNKHPDSQINQFLKILRANGFRQPGTVSNRSGLLVAGEGRYLALKRIGATHMPVMYQDFDTEEQEYQCAIADNALAAQAELDLRGIHTDLPDLAPFDLDLLGIENFQLEPDPENGEELHGSLKEKFLLPPFSVLDARQGYWQDRKRAWLALGIESEIGREEETKVVVQS